MRHSAVLAGLAAVAATLLFSSSGGEGKVPGGRRELQEGESRVTGGRREGHARQKARLREGGERVTGGRRGKGEEGKRAA